MAMNRRFSKVGRTFLHDTATGLGMIALASLLETKTGRAEAVGTSQWRGVVQPPHVSPRAKRVIYLYMAGGPSHLESFDHKPRLARMHGQPMPESYTLGQPIAQLQGAKLRCFAPASLSQIRQIGTGNCRDISPNRLNRGRYLHRPFTDNGSNQSRPGSHFHEHGHDDFWQARHGFLGLLLPRQRK